MKTKKDTKPKMREVVLNLYISDGGISAPYYAVDNKHLVTLSTNLPPSSAETMALEYKITALIPEGTNIIDLAHSKIIANIIGEVKELYIEPLNPGNVISDDDL